jgi:hypothetical protein
MIKSLAALGGGGGLLLGGILKLMFVGFGDKG